jgi:TonB-linked SusC/RagA family outer membrane protein
MRALNLLHRKFPVLFFFLSSFSVSAQNTQLVSVSGTVTDSARQPLTGVTAAVNNKAVSLTDIEGRFTLNVNRGSKIRFTAVGFEDFVYTAINNAADLTIALHSSANTLDNVVVTTALGIKRDPRSLSYSAPVVAGDDLRNAPAGNWSDALSGKVAGLNLVRSNSGPTGSNSIILRGESNLTGNNEALVVVDGVVISSSSGSRTANRNETTYGTSGDNMQPDYGSSLNDINPDDIESVTVLKGPGAAALYGQRGANGAVIITTKSGSSKRKGLGITLSSNTSIEQMNNARPDLQYEYGHGTGGSNYSSWGASVDGASTRSTSSAYGPRFNGQMFYQYNHVLQGQDTVRTPWVPYSGKNGVNGYFETGRTFTNTISIDGGTDRTTARFSFTNVQNKWITPNTGYDRNTVALSVNSKINDKLTISSKVNYTNKGSDNLPGAGYGNQSIMYWYLFWQPSANINWLKNYWQNGLEDQAIAYPFSSFPENPYAIAYEFINRNNRRNANGNLQATYAFNKELSLQVRTSLDFASEDRAQERPWDAGPRLTRGSYRTQDIFRQEASTDFLLKYAKKVNADFDFSITGGGSRLKNDYRTREVQADGLVYPGLYTLANAAGSLVTIPFERHFELNSFYGLFTAEYKRYLYLELTARQDWSSPLATANRTENTGFFYPSASTSFILSDFTRMPKAINYAKLRFSAAEVGSGGTDPYRTSYNYTPATAPLGGIFAGSLQNPGLMPNPNLRPLRTISFEAGTEVRMFKNRLGLDVTVYAGNTRDQHLLRIVDRSSGYTQQLINAGKVNNKGIEVALSVTPVSTKTFKWTSNVVFSHNKNKIVELADSSVVLSVGRTGSAQTLATIGGSMGDLYGRGFVRAPDGQVVFDAQTGVALIGSDVKYLGNTIPKYKIGWTNQFSYKSFRLNFLFDAQAGAVGQSHSFNTLAGQGKLAVTVPGRYNGIIGNGVVMNGDGKYIPNNVIARDVTAYYTSVFAGDNAEGNTFSTDFIKFREARLDFTLNANLTKKLGIQRATIGLYGRDLFIWSPWPAFDPEFGTLNGTDIQRGFEIAQFPSTRTMGVNLVVGL